MYQPCREEDLEEQYRGQLDDDRPSQYAFYYGTHVYQIAEKHGLIDEDVAEAVVYWLTRYLANEEALPECAQQSRYIVTKLLNEYPELRENYKL